MGASRERVPNPNSNSNSNSKLNPNHPTRSTIFVNNLPQALDIYGLKGIFNKAGSVLDAFIPVAPEGKRRFGFVRFKDPKSVTKSIQVFHNKVIRDSKISVFEAKRDLAESQTRKSGNDNIVEARRKESQNCRNQGNPSYAHLFCNKIDRVDLEDVNKRPCIKGKVSKEKLSRLLNNLVGETETPVRAEVIWKKLSLENVGVLNVTAIQKNKFILEFANENEADLALTGSQTLTDLFHNLKKWAWSDYTVERFVWVEVIGVPPQGWNLDNFRDIALTWGKLVGFDNSLDETIYLESIKMLVLTCKRRKIEEEVSLDLEGTSFRIWVEEVEEPILSQFYKAGDFVSEVFGQSVDEAEEEGEIREESYQSKHSAKFDGAVEVGRVEDVWEDDGEHFQVEEEVQGVSFIETGVERIENSLEFGGGRRSTLVGDGGFLVVEESKPSEEVLCKEDSEENYDSDDCVLSLSSIPRAFSSTQSSLKEVESDEAETGNSKPDGRPVDSMVVIADFSLVNDVQSLEGAPIKIFPPVDQPPFCFGAGPACQDRNKPKDNSSNLKKNLNLGEKRKARSPRGRGSSSRRRVVKRRKRKIVSVPLAVENKSSGSAQEEAVGFSRLESSPSSGVGDLAKVPAPDSPGNSKKT